MYHQLLNLKEDIGSDRPVDEDDTFKAKHAFKSIGYYDEPSWGMTPYPDQPLFDGIKKFQKDKGLFQDSLMVPKGETVTALNKALGSLNSGSMVKPMALRPGGKPSRKDKLADLEARVLVIDARIRELIDLQYKTTDPETLEKIRYELNDLGKERGEISREMIRLQ